MTSLRRLRTRRALAVAGLVAVAAPMLSSCGFDPATNRPNTIANGGFHIEGDVHVMAARIVSPAEGTGTFVATITVDQDAEDTRLTALSGEGLTVGKFEPIDIPSNGRVNLFTQGGPAVSGDFVAGGSVPVTLTFDNGDSIDVNAIVVRQCWEFADVKTLPGAKKKPATPGETYRCVYPTAPPIGEAE